MHNDDEDDTDDKDLMLSIHKYLMIHPVNCPVKFLILCWIDYSILSSFVMYINNSFVVKLNIFSLL